MLRQPLDCVHRGLGLPAGADLDVQVRAGGAAGGADIADVLPGRDGLPGLLKV